MPILNQRDYRSAKSRISQILEALSSRGMINEITAQAPADLTAARQQALKSELERIQAEVETYENLQGEIDPERALETGDLGLLPIVSRIARRLSQRDLAERLDMKEQQIQRYESERYAGMSVARYQRTLKALGIELHPRLTASWDADNTSNLKPELKIEPDVLREIRKRNWLGFSKETVKIDATKQINSYVDTSLQLLKGQALHRKSVGPHSDTAQIALNIWIARILQLSTEQRAHVKAKFNIADTTWLKQLVALSIYPDGPIRAAELLREKGILLVVEPQLPHTLLDGAALLLMDSIPVVGMTLRHDRLDNFWFTLLHELGHIFLHFNHGLEIGFVDDLDGASIEQAELDADSFAQSHLLPDEVWNTSPARFSKSSDLIANFAKARNLHPAIVAGRIRRDRMNYRIFNELVGRGQVRRLFLQTI